MFVPDEFDFKNYKSMDEYSKTVEGSKYLHSLYLKAVNHPIRRQILEILNNKTRTSKPDLVEILIENETINEESVFKYNMDFLIKAFCVKEVKDESKSEVFYEITQGGKVIDYLK